jgi:nucleotide-binding universal stress UspA family protein
MSIDKTKWYVWYPEKHATKTVKYLFTKKSFATGQEAQAFIDASKDEMAKSARVGKGVDLYDQIKEDTMKLSKLQALAEGKINEVAEPLDISTQTSIVEKVLRKAERELPHECRYKSFETLQSMKEVEWVTQESSDEQGKEAAKTIAKLIRAAGVKGWTVKVTIRDNYHGGVKTKWQGKAKS